MKSLSIINDKHLLSVLLDVKNETKKLFGDRLRQLILYGSYAINEQDTNSEIDIMILVDESEKKLRKYKKIIGDIMVELSMKHDKLISLVEVPYNRYEKYLNVLPFYRNVYNNGIEIYERNKN